MYTLLDRTTFYPDLVSEISKAKRFILIDAYIWIKDETGNIIAKAVLEAANRGVKIHIRKDLSASIFEHTPKRVPFFISPKTLEKGWRTSWDKTFGLMTPKAFNRFAFYIYNKRERPPITENALLKKICSHENICVDNYPFFNHGKLILIDEMAYVGGQCISNDYREWIDYNVKIQERKAVENIYAQIHGEEPLHMDLDSHFLHNLFTTKVPIHYVQKKFIDETTQDEELTIEMSYFGKWFIPILKRALQRKIKINILASKESDTNHHTNMWVLSHLLKTKSPHLKVFLSDRMVHTKGMTTRTKSLLGAANFHNACGYFKALNEQNIFSKNKALVANIHQRFMEDFRSAKEVQESAQLPEWSRLSALKEIASVYLNSYFVFINRRKIQRWRNEANRKTTLLKPEMDDKHSYVL